MHLYRQIAELKFLNHLYVTVLSFILFAAVAWPELGGDRSMSFIKNISCYGGGSVGAGSKRMKTTCAENQRILKTFADCEGKAADGGQLSSSFEFCGTMDSFSTPFPNGLISKFRGGASKGFVLL